MSLLSLGKANPEQGLTMLWHPADDGKPIPDPRHRDSMHLDNVRPKDVPRGTIRCQKDESQALRSADIEGATPAFKTRTLHLTGRVEQDPVPGSVAKTYYPEVTKNQDMSLFREDIDGAVPQATGFRTNRSLNPLNPRYNLPSYNPHPQTPPSQRMHEGLPRETMQFKGERTPRILERNYARNPADSRDIEGTQSGTQSLKLKIQTPRDPFKTIEQSGRRILSTKCVTPRSERHPSEPAYNMHLQTTHPFLASENDPYYAPRNTGSILGSTPAVRHRDNGEPQASLIRSDIAGAVPQRYKGAMPFNLYDSHEVTPSIGRHLGLDCKDIEGAQTGTRKAGTK